MRPIHHKPDQRIRAHVFLCMLAYYLQWHLKQRYAPLFAAQAKSLASKPIRHKGILKFTARTCVLGYFSTGRRTMLR